MSIAHVLLLAACLFYVLVCVIQEAEEWQRRAKRWRKEV